MKEWKKLNRDEREKIEALFKEHCLKELICEEIHKFEDKRNSTSFLKFEDNVKWLKGTMFDLFIIGCVVLIVCFILKWWGLFK